jgi:hypothetical protein
MAQNAWTRKIAMNGTARFNPGTGRTEHRHSPHIVTVIVTIGMIVIVVVTTAAVAAVVIIVVVVIIVITVVVAIVIVIVIAIARPSSTILTFPLLPVDRAPEIAQDLARLGIDDDLAFAIAARRDNPDPAQQGPFLDDRPEPLISSAGR